MLNLYYGITFLHQAGRFSAALHTENFTLSYYKDICWQCEAVLFLDICMYTHATSVVDETLFLFTWRSLGQPHPMWHQPQRSHLPCWVYPYGARPPHHRCLICWIQNSWKPFHVWGLWSKQSTHHRCWSYSQKRKGNRIHQWVTNISWVRCRL